MKHQHKWAWSRHPYYEFIYVCSECHQYVTYIPKDVLHG